MATLFEGGNAEIRIVAEYEYQSGFNDRGGQLRITDVASGVLRIHLVGLAKIQLNAFVMKAVETIMYDTADPVAWLAAFYRPCLYEKEIVVLDTAKA